MKALSIRQPWAWLIANGYKDIENRSWRTSFRGEFLIHAGKKFDGAGWDWAVAETNIALPGKKEYELGG
ncbi:MAG: ASCH domain-containing protein, partial [Desulfobacterales bacterium]|nr:ASCH domain-containing protein [Desulfobacterales bacterium]